MPRHVRIAEPSDFTHAACLLLDGGEVVCDIVAGTLRGFPQPVDETVVRFVRPGRPPTIAIRGATSHLRVHDTSASIASAIHSLLTWGEARALIDLSRLHAQRGAQVAPLFNHMASLLNRRSGDLLTHADIEQALGWVLAVAADGAKIAFKANHNRNAHST